MREGEREREIEREEREREYTPMYFLLFACNMFFLTLPAWTSKQKLSKKCTASKSDISVKWKIMMSVS